MVQLLLQYLRLSLLLFLQPPLVLLLHAGGTVPLWGAATGPPLLLSPQGGAHLQGLGLLRLQLDPQLLEVPVESQALLLGPLRELRGGVALLLQGQRELGHAAPLLLQAQL